MRCALLAVTVVHPVSQLGETSGVPWPCLDLAPGRRYLHAFPSMQADDNQRAQIPTNRPAEGAGPHGGTGIMMKVMESDLGFPVRLRALRPAVRALWVRGQLPASGERTVAVVGSRSASGAGCGRARELARTWCSRGWAVVSGGAFGIDAAGHEGALSASGRTFAVLGCGADVVYPDRHAALFARIEAGGGLISEYPPGTAPRPGQFPARNRIIVALADAVVVVEAERRSGALITARLAAERGRPLFAVPGSAGTDQILTSGLAQPLVDADDLEPALAGRPRALPAVEVPGAVAPLLEALRQGADTAAGLSRRLQLTLPAVMAALAEAELDGWVSRSPGNRYEVRRAH